MSDISLKLVNYATQVNSKLQLFTELNHNFIIGDIVYISGGYYDNTIITNPFVLNSNTNSYIQGYTVIGINYANHSIILEYNVSTLVYPYGTLLNPFGNPQDAVNLAYNTFTGNNLYNDIYISTNAFTFGDINTCNIKNGIFGTDTNQIEIRNYTTDISLAVVNHIASKNTRIHNATINHKTHTNDLLTKCILIEDDTLGTIANPYDVEYISITSNNNGFGFSQYERVYIDASDDAEITVITNGDFKNPKLDNIYIVANATKAKIGSKEPMYGCDINIIQTDGELNCIKPNSFTYATNSIVDTFIEFHDVIAESISANIITFNVNYNDIANKKWILEKSIYITGIITTANGTTFNDINTGVFGRIDDVYYTVGDINSAYIKIRFSHGFSEALIDCDFSLLRIHISDDSFNQLTATNCTIATVGGNLSYDYKILGTSTVLYGSYQLVKFDKTVDLSGTSYQLPISLGDQNVQYGDDTITTNIIQYANINGIWSAVISNSHIESGIIYDSIISDTTTNSNVLISTYLHNVQLNNGSKIEANVMWDYVKINFTADTVVLPNIVNNAYLGDRKTPWVTGHWLETLPITGYAKNINKIKGTRAVGFYNSQTVIDNIDSIHIEIPNVLNYQPSFDTTKQFVLIDHGPMTYVPTTWSMTIPLRNDRIIFANKLDNNTTLKQVVIDKKDNTLAGTTLKFPVDGAIASVDDNFVYKVNNYNYLTEARSQHDVSIDINQIIPNATPFPGDINNPALDHCFLKLVPFSGPDIDNLFDGQSETVPQGLCGLLFRFDPVFIQYAVPGDVQAFPFCMIEIERVITTKSTATIIDSIDIKNCNYIPDYYDDELGDDLGNYRYGFDGNAISIVSNTSTFPTEYSIYENLGAGPIVNLNLVDGSEYDVQVEFWFTWYSRSSSGQLDPNNANVSINRSWGKRTKHTINLNIVATNETFYIIDDNGTDNIIDDNGDTIVWI